MRLSLCNRFATLWSHVAHDFDASFGRKGTFLMIIDRHTLLPQDLVLQGAIRSLLCFGVFVESRGILQRSFMLDASVRERA
ncbi:MAG: hypothetical protein D6812_06785 [Deltaproteobacteria bacterium]|nr:MAG: hypothetical protein D6812_06785 [Deltaproteobacteria bacterium]